MEKVFICYHSAYQEEVEALAEELRLHGLEAWVDKSGGMKMGRLSVEQAKQAISEDCWAFLLYGSRSLFDRPFVINVEMPAALWRRDHDPDFHVAVLPRGIGFSDVSQLSETTVGPDLSTWHTCDALSDLSEEPQDAALLADRFTTIADALLGARLDAAADSVRRDGRLGITVSSRGPCTPTDTDLLHINATQTLRHSSPAISAWLRVRRALCRFRDAVCRAGWVERLAVRGALHLSLAALLGFVFPGTGKIDLEIEQCGQMWASDGSAPDPSDWDIWVRDERVPPGSLAVQLSVSRSVSAGVQQAVRAGQVAPVSYLNVQPATSASRNSVPNAAACRGLAKAVGDKLVERCDEGGIETVHAFIASPQAFAALFGRQLNRVPPVQLYEWDGNAYAPSLRLEQDMCAP